jgi:hypothetical protein
MNDERSILPTFDVFSAPNGPTYAPQPGADGLGKLRLFALSPVVAAVKGLGDDAAPSAALSPTGVAGPVSAPSFLGLAAILGIVGVLSYQAGKAIAPSRSDSTTWGWIGVPVGLFTGVVGLGVMGAVSNHRKG